MTEDRLKELIFHAMGEVSMCWSEIARAGIFDSVKAVEIGDRLVKAIMEDGDMERREITHDPR